MRLKGGINLALLREFESRWAYIFTQVSISGRSAYLGSDCLGSSQIKSQSHTSDFSQISEIPRVSMQETRRLRLADMLSNRLEIRLIFID